MRIFRSLRWILLALFLSVIPASSFAGVFISVGFAPPMLPVYEQPYCPEPGLMWMPGYWAYGDDGYYWVPGAWVPAPYEGALWTPPYWGWSSGMFMFHPGYWGRHVGYYGGVNYGFGYMGIGFVGGRWHGRDFEYNRAVMRVDEHRFHSTYVDRDVVNRYTVSRDSRVAFSGGPGGIRHDPRPEERMAERERHVDVTPIQRSHEDAARTDRSSYFKSNGGRPAHVVADRPLGGGMRGAPGGRQGPENQQRPMQQERPQVQQTRPMDEHRPGMQQQRPMDQQRQPQMEQPRSTEQQRPMVQPRPAEQPRVPFQQNRPADQQRPQMQQPRNPEQQRPMVQPRPAEQPRPQMQQPRQMEQQRPAQQARPEPQSRPAPAAQPRPEQQRHEPQQRSEPRPDHKEKEHR